jgi:hypothetical protein
MMRRGEGKKSKGKGRNGRGRKGMEKTETNVCVVALVCRSVVSLSLYVCMCVGGFFEKGFLSLLLLLSPLSFVCFCKEE